MGNLRGISCVLMVELAFEARSQRARRERRRRSRDQTGCRVTLFIIQISACPVIIRGKPLPTPIRSFRRAENLWFERSRSLVFEL